MFLGVVSGLVPDTCGSVFVVVVLCRCGRRRHKASSHPETSLFEDMSHSSVHVQCGLPLRASGRELCVVVVVGLGVCRFAFPFGFAVFDATIF
jgi:hypothetical protein